MLGGRGWKREGGKKLSCLKMRDTISRLPPSLCYGRSSREDYGPYSAGVLLLYASKYSFTFQRFYFRFFDVGALLAWRFLHSSASLGPQWPASQPTSFCPLSCRPATPKLQIYGSFDAGLKLGRPSSRSLPPHRRLIN